MFAKFALSFFALAAAVSASPLAARGPSAISLVRRTDPPSFDNWGGYASLSNFDNFYGVDDFSGSHGQQTVVQSEQIVCHSVEIEVIQQRLAVLIETAKRIITEQICEVETQVIVFEQFHGSMGSFSRDLRRYSGRQVGYDSSISGHAKDILNSDGSLSSNDLGFSGSDVGKNLVTVGGSNWVDASSPISVGQAHDLAKSAFVAQN